MVKKYVGLFEFLCFSLLISGVLTTQENNSNTTATAKSTADLFNKFHQNDYHLTFEWAEIVRFNKQYGKKFEIHTFKYNRTCTAINTTYIANVDLGNDLEIMIQAYKFASNEYRLFPMRFQVNFCESVTKNMFGIEKFHNCGNFSCPILKGNRYEFCNWAPDESMAPPFIPSGKYMMEVKGIYHSEELYLQRYYITISRPII